MKTTVTRHPAIEVRTCEFGWGVFTTADLPAGTLVERTPFLVLDPVDAQNPPLNDYVFVVTHNPRSPLFGQLALVLGWGSLFNHAGEANVQHHLKLKERLFDFVTTRAVSAGEQLFVDYGDGWWSERGRQAR